MSTNSLTNSPTNSSTHRQPTTQLMGILNVTPDSFFDQGAFYAAEKAIARGETLASQGADLLDIGGESSRPGATPVPEQEELERVLPVIKALSHRLSIPLSIDTTKPRVASAALENGASMINDISGFEDPHMIEIASHFQVPICVMHKQGSPATMQMNPTYPKGILDELMHWFEERLRALIKSGIQEKQIILDPGIGFGKTVADNLKIIHNLPKFKTLGFPLLLGISRKSFMAKIVGKPTSELLSTTLAINTFAVLNQVEIIRVHDVYEHRLMIDVMKELRN